MQQVAQATDRPICNEVQQVAPVCVTRTPGPSSGRTQPAMGGSGRLSLPTSNHLGHPRLLEPQQLKSRAFLRQWQCELRGSTRSVYEAKWTIFTKWCLSNQVDFRASPVKSIADFLLYLFQDRKLQPNSIDGDRSAIADKLGNSPINISKDENLTHLLDSFNRDRPKGKRGIPSWKLSLVVPQLTSLPFNPLKPL